MTPQTRLIILNSPANPTGGVTPKAEIDKLVAGLAAFPDAAILSDEIYGQMTYDGLAHQTLLAYPEIRDRLILLDGWSKTYAMTGWRLGYSGLAGDALRRGAKTRGQFLFLRQRADAIRRARRADRSAGRRPRNGRRIRRAPQSRRRGPQPPARRPRRDAEGRLLRFPQYFRDRLEGQSRWRTRCWSRPASRRSAGPISASTARVTSGCPTPIRPRTFAALWRASAIFWRATIAARGLGDSADVASRLTRTSSLGLIDHANSSSLPPHCRSSRQLGGAR